MPRHKLKSAKGRREIYFLPANLATPLQLSLIIALRGETDRGKNIHFCRLIPISDDGAAAEDAVSQRKKKEREKEGDAWNSVSPLRSCPPLIFAVMREKVEGTWFFEMSRTSAPREIRVPLYPVCEIEGEGRYPHPACRGDAYLQADRADTTPSILRNIEIRKIKR